MGKALNEIGNNRGQLDPKTEKVPSLSPGESTVTNINEYLNLNNILNLWKLQKLVFTNLVWDAYK